jgi:hypothetical protein
MDTPLTASRPINEDILKRLLYAVCNIGGNAEPEEDDGIVASQVALLMSERLFPTEQTIRDYMAKNGYFATAELPEVFDAPNAAISPEAVKAGAMVAVKLWLECMSAPDPLAYAEAEIAKGLNGERVE